MVVVTATLRRQDVYACIQELASLHVLISPQSFENSRASTHEPHTQTQTQTQTHTHTHTHTDTHTHTTHTHTHTPHTHTHIHKHTQTQSLCVSSPVVD